MQVGSRDAELVSGLLREFPAAVQPLELFATLESASLSMLNCSDLSGSPSPSAAAPLRVDPRIKHHPLPRQTLRSRLSALLRAFRLLPGRVDNCGEIVTLAIMKAVLNMTEMGHLCRVSRSDRSDAPVVR